MLTVLLEAEDVDRAYARPGEEICVYAYLDSFTSTSGVFLTQAVPEPGTFVALGLDAVALLRRRK